MAKTVVINGVTYDGVKKVQMPLATNPNQLVDYYDTSDVSTPASSVKLGEEFYSGGEKKAGTMPVNDAIDKTLDITNTTANIPEGYNPSGTVKIVPETKTVTPTKSAQDFTPSAGKVFGKFTVEKIPDAYQDVTGVTAAAADVKAGKKIVNPSGEVVTGTHTDPTFTLANGVLSIK